MLDKTKYLNVQKELGEKPSVCVANGLHLLSLAMNHL